MAWTAGKTWTVGDLLTSADVNTYIRDRVAWLFGETLWTALPYINGWTDFDPTFERGGYNRIGDQVCMQGCMAGGTMDAPFASAFPAAYRPAYEAGFGVMMTDPGGADVMGTVAIYTNGNNAVSHAMAAPSSTYVSLNACRWFIN